MTIKKKKTKSKFDETTDDGFDEKVITKNRRPIRDWTKAVSQFEEDIDYFEDFVDSRK